MGSIQLSEGLPLKDLLRMGLEDSDGVEELLLGSPQGFHGCGSKPSTPREHPNPHD